MEYGKAKVIAEKVKEKLAPHCERIEIAGSIRRREPEVGDVEIVAIPNPYSVGLFESGIATVLDRWEKVKGELPHCKYTQRIHPCGMKIDVFFAGPENWGLIFAIRTGSAAFAHKVLARGWVRNGLISDHGMLMRGDDPLEIPEERDLFRLAGVEWVEPEERNI